MGLTSQKQIPDNQTKRRVKDVLRGRSGRQGSKTTQKKYSGICISFSKFIIP